MLDYIQTYPECNITMAELADIAHLSPYHLAWLFKRTTGQSIHQYVLAQRLEVGKRLLETINLTIIEIAARWALLIMPTSHGTSSAGLACRRAKPSDTVTSRDLPMHIKEEHGPSVT